MAIQQTQSPRQRWHFELRLKDSNAYSKKCCVSGSSRGGRVKRSEAKRSSSRSMEVICITVIKFGKAKDSRRGLESRIISAGLFSDHTYHTQVLTT